MKRVLTLIATVILLGCNNSQEVSVYHYAIKNQNDVITGYLVNKITYKGEQRVDSIFRFDKNKTLKNIRKESYNIDSSGLKINNNYYLTTAKDTCYSYIDYTNDKFKACYLGRNNLELDTDSYSEVNVFTIEELHPDGITSKKYFDKNYVLLKEEYQNGLLDYYEIVRIDEMKELNNKLE